MVKSSEKALTLEEFLKQPETDPASEYIEGRVAQKPMPKGKHSATRSELTAAIDAVAKTRRIAYAFLELRCTFGGRSLVPDVAVFAWERLPRDESGEIADTFETPPDWAIEILSPDQSQTKVTGNILHCLQHGTRLGWLIDPAEKSVLVYPAGQQPELVREAIEGLPVPEFLAELRLTVGEVFGWLKL